MASDMRCNSASEYPVHVELDDKNTLAGGLSPNSGRYADGDGEGSPPPLNAVHQRRRVNPESLALRLGPDLVRDLDALITPGNTEMPSFAVRKELQERYSIDRRHIYDYFHSRGLRVVKEDKHGNPVTAKDLQPAPSVPNLRPLRQAPAKNTRSHPSYPIGPERNLFKPRGITKAKPGRPRKNPGSTTPKAAPSACETNEPTDTHAAISEHSSPVVVHHTYVAVNPLLPNSPILPMSEEDVSCIFHPAINPLDESFSVRRAIGDIAYAYRHKSVFERMQELAGCPAKYDESPLWNETLPCSANTERLLLLHTKPLTQDERHAIYEALSDNIGPAQGIQECQGTYRQYMEARTKLYFEGLLSAPYHHGSTRPSVRTGTPSDNPPPGTNEFRNWLSETRFVKRDVYGSPRLYHRNANVAKHQDVDGMTERQFRQRSIPHWLQTLEELFPTPSDNLVDPPADSPVVRTREITRITAPGDGCTAGDQRLFSVMSGLPTLSMPSFVENRPTVQAQLHGFSGIAGSPGAKVSGDGIDSRTQRLERDPCATHPGQHLALGDKLRKHRNTSNNTRTRLPSCSPRKHYVRGLDQTRTKPVTSRDARRRTTSAAGDI